MSEDGNMVVKEAEKSEKRRFFNEDLEEDGNGASDETVDGVLQNDLDNQNSFLFAGASGSPEVEESVDEIKEIKDVIPNLTDSQANDLLQRAGTSSDKGERIAGAVGIYFESCASQPNVMESNQRDPSPQPGSAVKLTKASTLLSPTPAKRIRDYGARLFKKRKPTVRWRRFIGSMQVSALATRPTVKPLKYGSELKILKTSSDALGKLYYANGRKKASMANYVRLVDENLNREVGRVPEDVAMILFPLVDSDELDFEATMIYCNNRRLSVGDSFIVQLDCFLTSVMFENYSALTKHTTTLDKRSFSQNVVESDEELRLKSRRLALISLFDHVQLRTTSEHDSLDSSFGEPAEVIDLDNEGDSGSEITKSVDTHTIQPSQIQDDVLNVNQLKSLYKSTLSMESSKYLPETTPSVESFKLELRRYQKQGLTWMLQREREFDLVSDAASCEEVDGDMMNPLWKKFRWPKDLSWASQKQTRIDLHSQHDVECFYANLHTGEFSQAKPVIKSMLKGGILADEMGLGKTISTLAMILSVPHDRGYQERKTPEQPEKLDADISILGTQQVEHSKPYAFKTTLVVVPMSLLSQWQQEFEKSVSNPELHCEIYYGGNTSGLRTLLTKNKSPPIVLITTYGTVQHEWGRLMNKNTGYMESDTTGLFSVEFFRIVIDEGHTIRNRNTRTSKSLMDLESSRRWILTGTPIINRLDDLYSLIKFMRLEPWSQVGYWKTFVSDPFEKKNYKSAFDVVSSILEPVILRRTKLMRDVDGKRLVELPPKEVIIEKVSFNKSEDALYQYFLNRAENSVKEGLDRGDLLKKYSTILVHILRLRQVCCHSDLLGSLDENDEDLTENKMLTEPVKIDEKVSEAISPSSNVSKEELDAIISHLQTKFPDEEQLTKLECSICTSEPIEPVTQVVLTECGHAFCELCILEYIRFQCERKQEVKCPNCRKTVDSNKLLTIENNSNKLKIVHYNGGSKSSKITSLVKSLKRLQDVSSGEQVVVFSQFSSFLDIMQREISASFSSSIAQIYKFDGRLSMKERSKVLHDFATKDLSKLKILLLSLKAGGVGLNLTCASRAYMMDPWWSPSLEDQAIDRIHRIGQVNDVKVVRFIMEHSIEEKMLRIQDRKRTLGEAVDADEDERRKRRIEEIQMLFE
ncbi:LAQU0S07e01948g1_1 [Lachancea quebecensis]|uniref:DNA repair protein RAD5 n=1 Tax=Lachancea quebecensis TaxID=1654605 RepID=A0A0P1KRT2_9SACH|nr:LAQU0S07e01948g1_1 [Lachancea quebecensis]